MVTRTVDRIPWVDSLHLSDCKAIHIDHLTTLVPTNLNKPPTNPPLDLRIVAPLVDGLCLRNDHKRALFDLMPTVPLQAEIPCPLVTNLKGETVVLIRLGMTHMQGQWKDLIEGPRLN